MDAQPSGAHGTSGIGQYGAVRNVPAALAVLALVAAAP